HVVEAVERDERAAHAQVIAMIVDIAVDRAADSRPFQQTVTHGKAAKRAGEVDAQARELDAGRRPAGLLWGSGDALERRLAAHRDGGNVQRAFRRGESGVLWTERDPHLAADELGIDVVETKDRAGIVGLEEDRLTPAVATPAQVPGERRIAAELGIEHQIGDHG